LVFEVCDDLFDDGVVAVLGLHDCEIIGSVSAPSPIRPGRCWPCWSGTELRPGFARRRVPWQVAGLQR
jgi:hypothetical protein